MAAPSARARVRAIVLDRLDEVSRAVVAAIQDEIPAYASLSREQVEEVGGIASWGTVRVLDLWVDDAALTPDDLRRFKGIGAARALDGRPLPAVLRAYRLAGVEVTTMVERVGVDLLSVPDTMAMARLWMASMDALSEAIYEGHEAASVRVTTDRSRAVGDLVEDLLVGRQVTRTGLAARAHELGVTIGARTTLTLLRADDAERAAQALLGDGSEAALLHVRGATAVVLTPPDLELDLRGADAPDWRGCRSVGLRVDQLPAASRLAEHVLDHAPPHAFRARQQLLDEGDAHAVGLLRRHPDADPDRLAAIVLGRLSGRGNRHVVEGLDAFLRTGSAAGAAAELGLHPQTLRHRVRRLAALTGRDLRNPWDHFVLECARLAGDEEVVTS